MTQERREDREVRQRPPRHDRDHDDRDRGRRRPLRVEIQYTFAVCGRPAPSEVHGDRFRLGDTVSTSEGPHKVIEVYWFTEAKARVLLRPIPEEKKAEKKPQKPQKSKKFNVKGTQTSRLSARKPAQRPARNQNQGARPRTRKN